MPSADRYSKSFMHREHINFITLTKCAESMVTRERNSYPRVERTLSSPRQSMVILNCGRSRKSGSSSSSTIARTRAPSSRCRPVRTGPCLQRLERMVMPRCLMLSTSVSSRAVLWPTQLDSSLCRHDQPAQVRLRPIGMLLGTQAWRSTGVACGVSSLYDVTDRN